MKGKKALEEEKEGKKVLEGERKGKGTRRRKKGKKRI